MAMQPGIFNEACAAFWRSAEAGAARHPPRVTAAATPGPVR
jgi:hypothetical protein